MTKHSRVHQISLRLRAPIQHCDLGNTWHCHLHPAILNHGRLTCLSHILSRTSIVRCNLLKAALLFSSWSWCLSSSWSWLSSSWSWLSSSWSWCLSSSWSWCLSSSWSWCLSSSWSWCLSCPVCDSLVSICPRLSSWVGTGHSECLRWGPRSHDNLYRDSIPVNGPNSSVYQCHV